MPNRNLTAAELELVRVLISEIRSRLDVMSGGDAGMLFAFRRKVYKELTYDERGKPMDRRRLKGVKRRQQDNRCPLCDQQLPERYCVLDRLQAVEGYTEENTRLICQDCDVRTQVSRGYT